MSNLDSIKPVRLGVVFAIIWGCTMLFLAISSTKGYGKTMFTPLANLYPWCSSQGVFGPLACLIVGALDGFVLGAAIGYLYNNISIDS